MLFIINFLSFLVSFIFKISKDLLNLRLGAFVDALGYQEKDGVEWFSNEVEEDEAKKENEVDLLM